MMIGKFENWFVVDKVQIEMFKQIKIGKRTLAYGTAGLAWFLNENMIVLIYQ